MSISKVLCVAVASTILCSGVAMARPDGSGQPPTSKQGHKATKGHHKHAKKLRKLAHRLHAKRAHKHAKQHPIGAF